MMRRAEIVNAAEPLALVTKPIPEPAPKGLLLKTSYAGVCHTDLHFVKDEKYLGNGKVFRVREAIGIDKFRGTTLGHEICGVIEKFGSEAEPEKYGLSIGDNVAVMPWIGCTKDDCLFCFQGNNNQCPRNVGGTCDIGQGPPGGYSTHVPVPNCKFVVKIPEKIPMHVACMLPCSAATLFSTLTSAKPFLEKAYAREGSCKLLIIGAGGLGLWGVKLGKQYFKDINITITITDIDESKLAIAAEAGADETIRMPREGSAEDIGKFLTNNRSNCYDVVVDLVATETTSEAGLHSLQIGGLCLVLGLYGGRLGFPTLLFILRSLSIKGNRVSSIQCLRDLVQFLSENPIRFEELEFFSLEDINEVHRKLNEGEIKGRAILKYVD